MENFMRSKTYILLAACLIALSIYFILMSFINGTKQAATQSVIVADVEVSSQSNQNVSANEKVVVTPIAIQPPLQSEWKRTVDPVEFAEQVDWFLSRGNYAVSGESEYETYDMPTLVRLSDSGDVRAMHALAKLYLSDEYSKQYGLKYAEAMYLKAAVYGSSYALTELAIIEDSKRFGTIEDDTRKQLVESFVYYKTAEIRGDRYGYLAGGDLSLKELTPQLTKEEKIYIEEKAKALYEKMRRERESLGLGEFYNSVPDAVKKLFDKLESEAK